MPATIKVVEETKKNQKKDVVSLAKERFKAAIDAQKNSRLEFEKDLDFKVGQQWDEKLKRDRQSEGRPCLTVNRIPQFTNQIINDIRQSRPALKVYPVDDKADIETAKILQGMLRHIEYNSGADVAYDTAASSAVDVGLGYFRVYTEYVSPMSFDQRVKIGKIDNVFSVALDPNSSEPDGSDAEYGFIFTDMAKSEFKRKYPKTKVCEDSRWEDLESQREDDWIKKDVVRIADYFVKEYSKETLVLLSNGQAVLENEMERYLAELYAQDPAFQGLITVKDSRETIVPKVMQYKIAGDEVLESTEFPAPFIPIIPVYGSVVNIKGEKHIYGIIRFARDPQTMYNIWVSAETEAIALSPKAPFVGVEGQFEGFEAKWATANVKTHAYLEYKPISVAGSPAPPPQRNTYEPAIAAITQARMGASEDMKATTGIYDAALGARSNETSGIAIRGRQAQAQTSNYHFSDNLMRSIRHLGKIIMHMIPKVYDTARIERIMGDDGSEELVHLNKEVIKNGKLQIFDVTVGEYDVAVETGPSFATKRQEAVASIMDFIRAYPQAAQVVGDLLVKNMDWPEAKEIADRLKKTIPAHLLGEGNELPPQAQAQIAQMQQSLQILQGQLQAATMKIQTKELEIKSRERIEAAKLETDLIKEQMKISSDYNSLEVQRQIAELNAIQHQEMLAIEQARQAELQRQIEQEQMNQQNYEAEEQDMFADAQMPQMPFGFDPNNNPIGGFTE